VHGADLASGAVRWQRNMVAEFKSRFGPRGCTMSPMIDGANVVIPTGAPAGGTTLISLNAATGETVWAADKLPLSLSTPTGVGTFGGERFVLYYHAKPPGTGGLTGLRTGDGAPAIAWQIDLKANMSDTAPLALPGNRVLLQTWNDSALIDVSSTPRILWTTTDLWALYPPPAHHEGALYGFGGNSTEFFSAVDVASGKTMWTERIYRGYVVNAGGTLVVQSESSGLLRLVAADPARYRELTRLQVFRPGARTTTPPTVAGGRVFVRNLEELVAVSTGGRVD
jgi:outer membrane protein assembly factor BamB